MKRKLSLLMAVVMLVSLFVPVMANDYNGHWAEAIIEKWVDMEKISGYPDGTFKPDNNITRAEFAKVLCSVFPYSAVEYENVEFTDVKEEDWYFESVRNLLTFEIIVKDEKFNPERELTREEAMTMAGRAFGYEIGEEANLDEDTENALRDYISGRNYFGDVFKRYIGQSPTAYRKETKT